jgi:hypothetical protein
MTATTFTNSAFVRSHVKQPRGFGHWGFQATTKDTAFSEELFGPVVWATGTLTEAKTSAVQQLRNQGVDTSLVAVLP